MTISTAPTPLSYNGNGATTAFPITWKYNAKSHVVATLRLTTGSETVWALDTDYTITSPGDTGTLTAIVAPASGEKLIITLEPPNTQDSDIPLGGDFPSSTVEDGLDLSAQRDAKVESMFLRALRVPKSDSVTGDNLEIPIDSQRANMFLAFDANGNPIAAAGTSSDLGPVTSFIDTLLDDADAPTAANTLKLSTASRSSNTILGVSDIRKLVIATSSFTQTLTAAATLGNGWHCYYRIESGATIVFDPNASETINGSSTLSVTGPSTGALYSDGTNIKTLGFVNADTFNLTGNLKLNNVAGLAGQIPIENAAGTATAWWVPRSYLAACGLSTAGSSSTMTIAAGEATDSTNVSILKLLSSTSKTTSSWAVGTGNGGLDTGAIANSTWYHFWLIMRVDTGVVDVLISLSATAPTMPTNYTLKRRIGSGKTDGSGNWTAFVQFGDYFRWLASIRDVNTTNPGTSAVSSTLTVPTGINVFALFNATLVNVGTATEVIFSDLGANDEAPSLGTAPLANLISELNQVDGSGQFTIRTNTSAQIRYRCRASAADVVVSIATFGWIDRRGQDS